jgi:DNA polymerase/3'-5' exonuclease PolX
MTNKTTQEKLAFLERRIERENERRNKAYQDYKQEIERLSKELGYAEDYYNREVELIKKEIQEVLEVA